jgi:hypothetical protein
MFRRFVWAGWSARSTRPSATNNTPATRRAAHIYRTIRTDPVVPTDETQTHARVAQVPHSAA